jgi:hypothetical protein
MVARVRGLMVAETDVARIDFSRTPVAGEDSLPFFLLSDCMSLFCAESENLPLHSAESNLTRGARLLPQLLIKESGSCLR